MFRVPFCTEYSINDDEDEYGTRDDFYAELQLEYHWRTNEATNIKRHGRQEGLRIVTIVVQIKKMINFAHNYFR